MQQDVAGVDGGEDVLCRLERVHCLNRRIAQLGVAGQIEERHQQPQVERSVDGVDVVFGDLDLLAQQRDELRRRPGFDLEPYDVAHAAAAQLALDLFELRHPPFVVELQFGVA
ncbi:MAG: hypothetical protein QM736_29995 [Vicinamibacterales bacterium]